jgi:CheY-like chemotaxis protein
MHSTSSVLIIDQDIATAHLIVEVLTYEGYIAYALSPGVDALATIVRYPPDLILLDMWMPDMSGAELIARLHDGRLVPIPIVLITTNPGDLAPLLASGSIDCLAKPFDLDDLLTCVAHYVRPAQVVDRPSA